MPVPSKLSTPEDGIRLLELLQHGVETSSTVLRLPRKYGYK